MVNFVEREGQPIGDEAGMSHSKDHNQALADYDVLHSIMTRRLSARRLKPDPIPEEYIERILEAGRWAMSGANSQPWEFIVVRDPDRKKALYDAYQDINMEFIFWMEQMREFQFRHPAFQVEGDPEEAWEKIHSNATRGGGMTWADAPALIVVLGDGRRQWGTVAGALTFGRHASHLTDGLANCCTHLHLAIASLGLGAQWVTIHIQDPFKRILKVPDLLDVYLIVSVGYADVERRPGVRRELSEMVHHEEYEPDKYMENRDILDYVAQLRGKTMFRYQLTEKSETETDSEK